jgi:hypothetical protein
MFMFTVFTEQGINVLCYVHRYMYNRYIGMVVYLYHSVFMKFRPVIKDPGASTWAPTRPPSSDGDRDQNLLRKFPNVR